MEEKRATEREAQKEDEELVMMKVALSKAEPIFALRTIYGDRPQTIELVGAIFSHRGQIISTKQAHGRSTTRDTAKCSRTRNRQKQLINQLDDAGS